ncbi:hypothetical protein [Paracoccus jeotgali]|uniref:hypothetical protein n=1 Tax=Paracoccus jeotgali TaxID=2065379 RepID=UPI001315575F|nr:hypothetical protein [Paracoccus jeotgali]
MIRIQARGYAAATIAVCAVLAVIAGLVIGGGPMQARMEKRDLNRLSDLRQISAHIACLAEGLGRLPDTPPPRLTARNHRRWPTPIPARPIAMSGSTPGTGASARPSSWRSPTACLTIPAISTPAAVACWARFRPRPPLPPRPRPSLRPNLRHPDRLDGTAPIG